MNVLSALQQRNGQWYYLSAVANMGLGNNMNALNDIRRLSAWNRIICSTGQCSSVWRAGGTWYQEQQNPFGGMPVSDDSLCLKLCLANMACSVCCPGSGILCC